jgi:hypothetical protein
MNRLIDAANRADLAHFAAQIAERNSLALDTLMSATETRCPHTATIDAVSDVRCGNVAGHDGDCWFLSSTEESADARETERLRVDLAVANEKIRGYVDLIAFLRGELATAQRKNEP